MTTPQQPAQAPVAAPAQPPQPPTGQWQADEGQVVSPAGQAFEVIDPTPEPAAPEPGPTAPPEQPEPEAVSEPEPEPEWVDPDSDWPHQWLDFHGDRLAVRLPQAAQILGLQYAVKTGRSEEYLLERMNKFLTNQIAPASYERLLDRMQDPDGGYGAGITWELINELSKLSSEQVQAETVAAAEAVTTQAGGA